MEPIPAGHALALWSALHILLLLGLSLRVVQQRRRHGVAMGDGGVPELACAIRAFGNATEYIPMGLVGLAALTLAGAPSLAVHPAGLVLFGGRVAHGIGLSRSGEASRLRAAGVAATWGAYIYLAVALLFYALP
ncbi:MAPEG family protein [Phenylobacterium sp.]|jgi:uncharacterized membrane protein YecN with MAPEG domain|uniref:MAPEG family protein n=1 Tax=Phenylobacterium sp. TaxID=1871053 RepID=UPI0025D9F50C|nr:MAPEG family protein [Phenylobacterium sp.]MCA3720807.1 MAPEG family protein [Phenylobacterium sp.]